MATILWHHRSLDGLVQLGWMCRRLEPGCVIGSARHIIAFARLVWWQALLGLVFWPYFLGLAAR